MNVEHLSFSLQEYSFCGKASDEQWFLQGSPPELQQLHDYCVYWLLQPGYKHLLMFICIFSLDIQKDVTHHKSFLLREKKVSQRLMNSSWDIVFFHKHMRFSLCTKHIATSLQILIFVPKVPFLDPKIIFLHRKWYL